VEKAAASCLTALTPLGTRRLAKNISSKNALSGRIQEFPHRESGRRRKRCSSATQQEEAIPQGGEDRGDIAPNLTPKLLPNNAMRRLDRSDKGKIAGSVPLSGQLGGEGLVKVEKRKLPDGRFLMGRSGKGLEREKYHGTSGGKGHYREVTG